MTEKQMQDAAEFFATGDGAEPLTDAELAAHSAQRDMDDDPEEAGDDDAEPPDFLTPAEIGEMGGEAPLTDADIAANTADFDDADVQAAIKGSTPAMRALLTARPED